MATPTAPGDARRDRPAHPASLDEPSAGTRVGRYVIVERLGAGGMSQVYRADDPELRRPVAIKLMRPDLALSAAARERFAREGQAMARLTHPHVATVFDVGQHGGRFFLAIELLEGGTLGDWLRTPRGEREVSAMMRAAARGLAAAHACGIVHRDFKPDNVLLTGGGVPRVSDFGLAASNLMPPAASGDPPAGDDRLTAAGAVMGTPAYMAPEQRDGKPADERADQYSLCLVWLEALGRDRAAPAGDPGGARGGSALIRVLMRGLAIDPDRRWPSVAALLAALDDLERVRRRRGRAIAAAIAMVVVAAGWIASRALVERGAPSPPPAQVLKRHKPGEGPWRMTLAGDGETLVRDNGSRDALWLEQLDRPGSTPLPLPPGRKVSRRMDAFPGVSRGGETVLVRADDGSLWVTGRARDTALLLRDDGSGAACLHPAGDRAVVAAMGEPLEIRATADGRLLATGPIADLCTWLGDRVVLGMRQRATLRLRVLDLDGSVRDLLDLPGHLGGLTVDRRGRIVIAHHLLGPGHRGTGALTAVPLGGAPVALRRGDRAGYQFVAATARGLFVARVPTSSRLAVAGFDPARPAAPLDLRSLDTGTSGDGAPVWLAGDRLLFSHDGGGMVAQHVTGPPDAVALAGDDQPLGLAGDELITLQRRFRGADDLQPRCAVLVGARTVSSWPCDQLGVSQCHGGRCVIGRLIGDQVQLAELDLRDGTLAPPVATRPMVGTPHAVIGRDGRWVVESGGELTLFDPATATATPFPTGGWIIDDVSWAPDGGLFAASRSDDRFTLLHLALDGTATVLASSPQSAFGAPAVSPSGRWLIVPTHERLPEYVLIAER